MRLDVMVKILILLTLSSGTISSPSLDESVEERLVRAIERPHEVFEALGHANNFKDYDLLFPNDNTVQRMFPDPTARKTELKFVWAVNPSERPSASEYGQFQTFNTNFGGGTVLLLLSVVCYNTDSQEAWLHINGIHCWSAL
jgi:hypothetical protein